MSTSPKRTTRRDFVLAASAAGIAPTLGISSAHAQKKYAPGVTDTEIKIGQSIPYSGPASAYGAIGRAQTAYFKSLNDRGGINGRKINFISLDDGFTPPKALENVRRLVEQDEVAFIFCVLGTPLNLAVRPYLNQKKVPHLFNAAGSQRFADPEKFPWTMGWQPSLRNESVFYAKRVLATKPGAKIAAIYQDDDFGKEMVAGLKEGLGDKAASMIVSAESFQATDPTIDSQILATKAAGADTVMMFAYAKQCAQAIRKIHDIEWRPDIYLHLGSASVGATLQPAGLDRSVGVRTAGFIKDTTDPQWQNDAELKPFFEFFKKYMPDANLSDSLNLSGWAYCLTLEQVLKQCGDDLSRENIMRQAANLKDYRNPALLPGSLISTSPTDYSVITYMKVQRFDGKVWQLE